jgi:hypothetical protein
MGVETPIPPFAMDAAAPDGAPPRRINYREHFGKYTNCPPCPARGPEAGSPHICNFHDSIAN